MGSDNEKAVLALDFYKKCCKRFSFLPDSGLENIEGCSGLFDWGACATHCDVFGSQQTKMMRFMGFVAQSFETTRLAMRVLDLDFGTMLDSEGKERTEEWREYPGEPDYMVSSFGRICGMSGKLVGRAGDHGYIQVYVVPWGRTTMAHIMVIDTFGPPKPTPEHEVDHIDNCPGHNYEWNLQWLTHAENIQKSYTQGRIVPSGASHPSFGKTFSSEVKAKMAARKTEYWKGWRESHGLDRNIPTKQQTKGKITFRKPRRKK